MDGDKEKISLLYDEIEGDNDINEDLHIEEHDVVAEISDDGNSNNDSYEDR